MSPPTVVGSATDPVVERPRPPLVDEPTPTGRPSVRLTVAALAIWAALIAVGRWWGLRLIAAGTKLVLPTPPVLGVPGPGLTARILIPAAVAALVIGVAPVVVRRLSWRWLLVVAVAGVAVWSVSVALVDPPGGLTRGPSWTSEYGDDVPSVAADPARFLRTFTDDIHDYQIHVRGHPPGMVLVLALMDRADLGGPGWEAALVIASGALAAAAALVAAREVAGEQVARRAAPFLVLAPAAIWIATSADAFFLGVTAWSVACLILAMHRSGRRSDLLALAGGILFGFGMMLSYGVVLVALVPLAVAVRTRRWRPLGIAAVGVGAVVAAFAVMGFWWVSGLLATKHQYDTLDLQRPYRYFVVNNLSAWALALGPATAVALTRLRDRGLWLLVGAGVGAAMVADLTGLSEGEVERIWLPFTIWVLLAGSVLAGTEAVPTWRAARGWLAVQAASAIVLVSLVTTQW